MKIATIDVANYKSLHRVRFKPRTTQIGLGRERRRQDRTIPRARPRCSRWSTRCRPRGSWRPWSCSASLSEAQAIIEPWRREYNTERPHRGPGQQILAEYAALFTQRRT